MEGLTHLDDAGRPRMVDVSAKGETWREAVAKGRIWLLPQTLQLIATGQVAKGDVMTTARLAGIMAAKRTPELIPLCHPIPLTDVEVEVTPFEDGLEITATVRTVARTGVEMEALVAVTVAALTIYDMVKAVDRSARIGDVRLVRKSGGKSGELVLE
ncbi:MAG: cyclic pyranopterin monophosphate synthase MoaC [Dehalococcoidia bacterium]|nr:cyclic pyranopterin monophosphate synthase MoaC [Dehalococcoidia bacterium]